MKIGLDVAQTCTPRAGCAWYADSLARAMVKLAPEDHFFLYHQFGNLINPDTSIGTAIDAPNVTPTFTDVTPEEASRIWHSPEELVIKTGAPDIVHAMSFRAPRVPGAKLVFTVYDVSFWAVPHHTTEENRLACQQGVLQALSNADGFIFISQSSKNEFERFLPGWLEENQIPWVVTPLAPRVTKQAGAAVALHERCWLAVGSIEPRKNYAVLLDALEVYWKTSSRRLRLRVTGGRGWKSAELHARISALAGAGMLEYLGYVSDETLAALYPTAEALIFPSWYEGFGLPVIEAMTLGCPVICSDNTSLREVGGDAPLYIDPNDPGSIAQAMLTLESSCAHWEDRRVASLAQAIQFSWTETARKTLAFYAEVKGRVAS